MPVGEERGTGKPQDSEWAMDSSLLHHRPEQAATITFSKPQFPHLEKDSVSMYFRFAGESWHYFVWKSFVKGPTYLNFYY